jgi:hypothetical protein
MRILLFVCAIVLFSGHIYGQSLSDCNAALSNDLKDVVNVELQKTFKTWLYEYIRSDQQARQKKKQTATFTGTLATVIEALPTTFSSNGRYDNLNTKFRRVEQEVIRDGYLTDEQSAEIITSTFGPNQLAAYLACIGAAERLIAGEGRDGVFHTIGGDTSEVFWIQVVFKSSTGGRAILKSDIMYANLDIVDDLMLRKDVELKRDTPITQYFRRLHPDKEASVIFNFQGGIANVRPITIGKSRRYKDEVPVGTIVASVLDYRTFLRANHLDPDETDTAKQIWIEGTENSKSNAQKNIAKQILIPCDCWSLQGGIRYPHGNAPDLRGVFIRGINDFGVADSTVRPLPEAQKNPDNTLAGQFQDDTFQGHQHQLNGRFNDADEPNGSPNSITADNSAGVEVNSKLRNQRFIGDPIADGSGVSPRSSVETRPNNVTVYYYIKIN